jgi:hypothetical protein
MKGDFTRDSFDPSQEFYRVLMQQGRVHLDADWNEQIAILLHRFEKLIVDVYGPYGGPAVNCGFAVFQDNGGISLGRGRYYVDGMQCENRNVTQLTPPQGVESQPAGWLVYLDVFEQYIAASQEPALTDVALGGLDTAARSRIRWTVGFWPLSATPAPAGGATASDQWQREWESVLPEISAFGSRGLLQARAQSKYGYSGAQNQLYRIEIHQGGIPSTDGNVTWKWSRENGSVAFAITAIKDESVELQGGATAVGAFAIGDWVEIVTDADLEDALKKPALRRVTGVDPSAATITLDSSPGTFDDTAHQIVRQWNQQTDRNGDDLGSSGGCVPLVEGEWLPIESGIEISFTAPGKVAGSYRGGDYWIVPARTATATIEWPSDDKVAKALRPHGVKHRYAPLAVVNLRNGVLAPAYDYRIRYKPPAIA